MRHGPLLLIGVGSLVGFVDDSTHSGFDLFAPGLPPSYNLTTSIGPINGALAESSNGFPTSLGTLSFSNFAGDFTAFTVPEPGTYVLLGSLGLTGAAFLRRRRAR